MSDDRELLLKLKDKLKPLVNHDDWAIMEIISLVDEWEESLSAKMAVHMPDEDFTASFRRGKEMLGFSDGALADLMRVSRPTINRWSKGLALPHPAVRRPLLYNLSQIIESEIMRWE